MGKTKRGLLVLASAACVFLVTSCVNHEEDKTSYKLTVTTDEGVEKVTIKSGDDEVSDLNSIEEGTELTAVIDLKDDFETSAVTLDGTEIAVTDGLYTFTMPSKDATFDVKTESTLPPDVEEPVVNEFKLTIIKDEHISSVKVFEGETEITDLTKVEKGKVLIVKVETQENFAVGTVKFNGQVVTSESDGTYKVTMADKDSTLEVTSKTVLKEYVVSISIDKNVEGVVLKVDGEEVDSDNKVLEGSTVTVEVTCEAHYVVDEILMNDEALNAQDDVYTFVMPQEDVDLEISSKLETISTNISVNADALDKATVSMKLAGKDYTFGTDVEVSYNSLAVLTVVPEEGLKVKSVKFDDKSLTFNGTTVQFNVTSGGNHALTIEFAKEMEFTYVDLTAEIRRNQFKGFEVKVNGNAAKEDTVFFEGDEIEFSALLDHAMPAEQVVFYTSTDSFVGTDERVSYNEKDLKLTYSFELSEETSTILVGYNNDINTTGSSGVSVDIETDGELKAYGYLSDEKYNANSLQAVFVRPDEDYTIDKIIATFEDGSKVEFITGRFGESWNGLYGTITLHDTISGKGNVSLKVEGSIKQSYNVTYDDGIDQVNGNSPTGEAFKTSYREGEQVTVYNISAKDTDKYIKDIKIDGVENPNITISGGTGTYTFVMPANDITITITLADKGKFNITGDEGFEGYHVRDGLYTTNDLESAIPGTDLYVFVDVKDGYLPFSATVGEDEMEIQSTSIYDYSTVKYYVQVTMPNEGALNVTFKTQKAYKVSYEQNNDYSVSLPNNINTFAEGSSVSFNVSVRNQAKRVVDVTVTDEAGENEIEVSSGMGGYSFIMPAYDVKINVVLEDIPSKDITVKLVNSTGEESLDSIVNQVTIQDPKSGYLVNYSSYNPQPTVTLAEMLEGVKKSLLEGSSLNMSIGVSSGYKVTANFLNVEGVRTRIPFEVSSTYNGLTYYANNIASPDDFDTLEIEISKAEPVTVTIEGGEGLEYTLTSNGVTFNTETIELDFMASFTFEVTSEAEGDYTYVYKVTKADGSEVTAGYNGYSATEDLTITIEKIKAYTFTIDNQADVMVYNSYLYTSDATYSAGALFTESVTVGSYYFSFSSPVNFELKVGDDVVASGTGQSYYSGYATFEITGNVVLTVTPVE